MKGKADMVTNRQPTAKSIQCFKMRLIIKNVVKIFEVRSSYYPSKFHVVQYIVYNNVFFKFKAMYYTILNGLYRSIF